jgi:ABC-type multidrug transport system fused ATPase/permease subunit
MNSQKVDINQYFIDYLWENKILFLCFIVLLGTYPLQKVIMPKYYGTVISSLNGKNTGNSFVNAAKSLLYLYAFIQLLFALLHMVQGKIIPKFSEFAAQRIFSNLLNNKHLNFENIEIGEILAKMIKLPNIIYKYLDLLRTVVFSQVIVLIVSMVHYYNVSFTAFLYFTALVIGIMILQFITYSLTMNIEIQREKEKDNIYQHLQDILNNLISVIICKHENYEKNYLHEKFIPFIKVFNKSLSMNFIMRLVFALFNIISFILLNFIIYKEYINKNINKEDFISSFIVTYSILSLFTDANYSIRLVVDMYSQVKDMENYFNKASDIDNNIATKNSEKKKFSKGTISFQNISYKYEENSDFDQKYVYALKNINLDIAENEDIAIIGQIGSGKSTLVKLLLKLQEPTEGDILINGINLKDIHRDELYDHVFYIPQKPKLLNRTLYENIVYGLDIKKEDKSQMINKINNILKFMNIENNIIDIFNEKMDQPLGNDGVKLSGGQRQMVWIIRAMLRNPSIIIFDEPTSALDKKNKENIMKIIKTIGKNKTIIVISHDEIKEQFKTVTLKQGEIVNHIPQTSFFTGFNF